MKQSTSEWMNRIFRDWNLSRIMRLTLGIVFIVLGFISKEHLVIFFGILFLLQGMLNISCCGAGGCSLSENKKQMYKDIIKPYKPKK